MNDNNNLVIPTIPRHGKTAFGRALLNDFIENEYNYKPYSTPSYTQHQGIQLRWSEDEIKAEQDRFGVSGNNLISNPDFSEWSSSFQRELENFPDTRNDDASMYSAMALRAFGIDKDRVEKLKNDMIFNMILFKYRKALKIQARRKAIISAYALRYTEFCKLNAESRRKQKRVSEQFKELVEWKLK